MSECEQITIERTWCRNPARPGQTTCAAHADGPRFEATADDYRAADAREHDRLTNDR